MAWVAPIALPLALLIAGTGQDVPLPAVPQPAAPDPAATTIALTQLEERMTVPVQIDGGGPYRFIIDTGSERTVISRELAGRLQLAAGRSVNVTSMSGTSRVATVILPSVTLSSVPHIGRIEAPALEAAHLGASGLLGIDTLKDHRIEIDFDADTMAVTPSFKRKRTDRALPGEIVVRAKSLLGQLIVTDAEFAGQPVRVIIDTGSPVSVANTAFRRLARRTTGRFTPLELTSATGGTIVADYARVDRLRVGSIEFVGMPIAFSEVAPFKRFGLERKPAILLGMNALKFFRRVQIDFPNREVRFRLPRGDRMAYRCTQLVGDRCTA